jgi:uncharacterized protein YdgA (DUF945 family)
MGYDLNNKICKSTIDPEIDFLGKCKIIDENGDELNGTIEFTSSKVEIERKEDGNFINIKLKLDQETNTYYRITVK